ncbi:MAG: hypothetical protein NTX47_05450 [Candidatus Omnitrophica bacterium]|nr:hypothetical protein [Candidatus Omnitrophota bacterium]
MTRYISKIILSWILMTGLCGGLGIGYAEEKEDPNIIKEVMMKKMTGEVAGISQNFISILYGQDEKTSYEMAFDIDKDVKIENKEDLKQINIGNIVAVSYEETTEKLKDDKEGKIKVKNRTVKRIVFIKEREGGF